MSNLLANQGVSAGSVHRDRALAWQVRDVLGVDPFRNIRMSVGSDYEIRRVENGYDLEVPCAGFNSSHIEVSIKDDVLTIAGKNERRSFSRSFTLPEDVDLDSIEAIAQDGILKLSIRQLPETQPKKIAVK